MGILDKIKEIEAEMARTQKNKATEYHLGLLKGKIAKLKRELMEGQKSSGGPKEGFDVTRSGNARVAMIGFPSVGKSTLLTRLTATESTSAAYEFTTLTAVPGVIHYKGAEIQLIDLPGIIEGAASGRGRGRQVIAVARNSDAILLMLDATKAEIQLKLLTKELEDVGIRINKERPNIFFKVKTAGGIAVNSTVKLTKIDERMIRCLLQLHKIHHAEILFNCDASVDDFIDVIEGNRKYMPALIAVNKADLISIEDCERIARLPNHVLLSCNLSLNIEYLVGRMWDMLDLIRVYTKRRGVPPDFSDPLVVRRGSTVETVCKMISRELLADFKLALVWGTSTKHNPQQVSLQHVLDDEDVLMICKKI